VSLIAPHQHINRRTYRPHRGDYLAGQFDDRDGPQPSADLPWSRTVADPAIRETNLRQPSCNAVQSPADPSLFGVRRKVSASG